MRMKILVKKGKSGGCFLIKVVKAYANFQKITVFTRHLKRQKVSRAIKTVHLGVWEFLGVFLEL